MLFMYILHLGCYYTVRSNKKKSDLKRFLLSVDIFRARAIHITILVEDFVTQLVQDGKKSCSDGTYSFSR